MTSMPKHPWIDLPPNEQDKSLFLREADSALCDSFCERIVKDGLNLAIVGANGAIVDHYCSMLVKQLRTLPAVRLEVHSTSDTEALLDSFNTILGSLTTAEATGGRNTSAPLRILIASDADHINPVHGRLLARLVSNFPGANTQLILLQTDSGGERPLNILGNRLLHWLVPMPSPDEAKKLLHNARHNGRESEVAKLLNKINPLLLQDAPSQSTLLEPTGIEETHPDSHTPDAFEEDTRQDTPPERTRSAHSLLLLWGIMIIVSALVVIGLFPRQYGAMRSALFGQAATQSENTSPQTAQSQPPLTSTHNAEEKIPVGDSTSPLSLPPLDPNATTLAAETKRNPTADSPGAGKPQYTFPPPLMPPDKKSATVTEKPFVPTLNPALSASRVPAMAAGSLPGKMRPSPEAEAPVLPEKPAGTALAKAPLEAPAVIRKDATPMKPAQEQPTPSAAILRQPRDQSLAEPATNEAIRKIRATPSQHIYVQHVALDSYSDARDWRSANPAMSASLVVAILSGKTKFVVVSGPFKTRTEALEFLRGSGIPSAHWLRSAGSLANALAQTN